MRTRIITRLLAACITTLPLLTAGTAPANTVDIVHDGFGAYDAATLWGGSEWGDSVAAGVYMLNKTGDTGIGNTWHNGLIPSFCVELQESAPQTTYTYTVGMPEDLYNSYTGEVLGVTRANYLRELWARYYDPAWAGSSPSLQDDRAAEAFAAAVWEILYEDLPNTPMGWDVTVDGTENPVGGFWAEDLDAATANKWLHSLTGGPKADLRVFSVDGAQNYLVAVPEPATLVLLGLGGLCSFLGRRRA